MMYFKKIITCFFFFLKKTVAGLQYQLGSNETPLLSKLRWGQGDVVESQDFDRRPVGRQMRCKRRPHVEQ